MKKELIKLILTCLLLYLFFHFIIILDYLEIGFDFIKYRINLDSRVNESRLDAKKVNKDIVVIGYSWKSSRNEVKTNEKFLSWQNHVAYRVVSYLTNIPRLILLDFGIYDLDARYDRETTRITNAMKRAGNVFLDFLFLLEFDKEPPGARDFLMKTAIPQRQFIEEPRFLLNHRLECPALKTLQAAKGFGSANTYLSVSAIFERMMMVDRFGGEYFETILLRLIRDIYGVPLDQVYFKRNGVYLKKGNGFLVIPTDDLMRMRIFMDVPSQSYVYFPFEELSSVPRRYFKDKIVLVGAHDYVLNSDIHFTYLGQLFGIELIANALNTVLKGKFYKEFNPLFYLFLAILLNSLICLANSRVKFNSGILFIILYFIAGTVLFGNLVNLNMSYVLLTMVVYSLLYRRPLNRPAATVSQDLQEREKEIDRIEKG